jgi:two-component sensor histidine kinase
MALVHERLYQTEDLARIDFGGYLEDLTANLLYALGGGRDIALRVDAADLFINVNSAIPCGLIVNELVTNALKYAFPEDGDRDRDRDREICVVFESRDGEYVLVVSDNGVGLPPELDWRATESLGLKLVDIWATYQLGGSIELDTRQGTAFTVKFSEW